MASGGQLSFFGDPDDATWEHYEPAPYPVGGSFEVSGEELNDMFLAELERLGDVQREDRMSTLDLKMERLRQSIEFNAQQIREKERELAKLEDIPQEPTNEPAVIYFEKRFVRTSTGAIDDRAKKYTYSAIRAGDGKWYTTGPKSPKGYTWEELWAWMGIGVDDVWIATELEPLGG